VANDCPRAVIFGFSGPELNDDERRLFAETGPLGFILFSRNCVSPEQVRALVLDLRETVGRADAPVLIDQEGGRVARLGPPHWRAAPAAARFAEIADVEHSRAVEAARLNARLLAAELADLGIDVDCAPVLDVPQPGAHRIIGDRAYGDVPERVALLGRATCEGLLAGGVLPVIKHIPGHGRATADSHADLPVVDAPREELERVDFAPFRALNAMPWAMTAHVVYTALDPAAPATTSSVVIEDVIRGSIGFDGVLVSDDLCMNALEGPPESRARAALAAGCDIALHCNGVLAEMKAVAAACRPLTPTAQDRLSRARSMRHEPEAFEVQAALYSLSAMLGKVTP
jgi:beta-N-acetylhexosaminidase